MQATPREVGIALANWNWKVVCRFIKERCGIRLCRSACTRYLHRLGFVYKRPKKRLLKADDEKRAAFVVEYVALLAEARATGAKLFFADEAHFRADGDLAGKWVLKGHPPWSTRPARAGARRRVTTRRSAWRPGRSSTWN